MSASRRFSPSRGGLTRRHTFIIHWHWHVIQYHCWHLVYAAHGHNWHIDDCSSVRTPHVRHTSFLGASQIIPVSSRAAETTSDHSTSTLTGSGDTRP